MQQRVVIAMALASDPKLLVLDEPTTGLDATVEASVLDLVRTLRNETNAAVLLIAHNLGVIRSICDRVGLCTPADRGGRERRRGVRAATVPVYGGPAALAPAARGPQVSAPLRRSRARFHRSVRTCRPASTSTAVHSRTSSVARSCRRSWTLAAATGRGATTTTGSATSGAEAGVGQISPEGDEVHSRTNVSKTFHQGGHTSPRWWGSI